MRVRQTVACVRTTRNCSQHDSLHYLIAQSSKHQWSSAVFICLVHSVPVDEVLQHSRFLSQSCSIVQRMRILIITVRGRQEKEVQLQNGGKNCKLRSTDLSLCACVWNQLYLSKVLMLGIACTGAVSGAPSSGVDSSFSSCSSGISYICS